MKVEDNHYMYRIETKDSNGSIIDFVDIDTVEPLRCAYDVQDELNLETNEHIKRVEEIILNADSTEFWYVDEDRSTDTHLVCYFEEVQLMANADHPMVDTDRSLFEYGKINANEYQDTNFICTHVLANGVSRIYMSIDKDQLLYQTYTNETIKEYIAQNPITIWYAIRYPVSIPRSMSKGHLLTLDGQTDVSISTNGKEVGLPLVKFNIGETEYNVDNKTLSIKNTTEGAQIRNIVLEGNTPINYARGNGVNTTEATSDTRYDFDPFYDGQTTIQGTVEGGYVSAKLYGDTMVNIAKPYGETPLLTATNVSTSCDDLLGMNEEGIVLADGEITEGRIVGNSAMVGNAPIYTYGIELGTHDGVVNNRNTGDYVTKDLIPIPIPNKAFLFFAGNHTWSKCAVYDANESLVRMVKVDNQRAVLRVETTGGTYVRFSYHEGIASGYTEEPITYKYDDGSDVFTQEIQSVVNPTICSVNKQDGLNLFDKTSYSPRTLVITTGELNTSDNPNYWTSDYILVFSSNSYTWSESRQATEICYYDTNKNFIKGEHIGTQAKFTPPQDGYMRFTFNKDIIDTLQLGIEGTISSDNYKEYKPYIQQIALPYTLNKLPNGVADYIDVVNKVHVQRVGKIVLDGTQGYSSQTWGQRRKYSFNVSGSKAGSSSNINTICDKLPTKEVWTENDLGEYVFTNGDNNISIVASDIATLYPITVLYELKTPIYTPLTNEEIAQLPLSAYKDGYINLSSDQLMPSFEFRMRASNRYQVDMLETGYYYLNAPVGNVRLGTANVDAQQMPCIVKVDNVGTGDGGYRLGLSNELRESIIELTFGGYFNTSNGEVVASNNDAYTPEYLSFEDYGLTTSFSFMSCENSVGTGYGNIVVLYDEEKEKIRTYANEVAIVNITIPTNAKYFRVAIRTKNSVNPKAKIANAFTTLAKLPSHRIPTSFTQGMKCGTDFGYWEGAMESKPTSFRTANPSSGWSIVETSNIEGGMGVVLNRIEIGLASLIIEDELDIATGKFTKRVGKLVLDGSSDESWYSKNRSETYVKTNFFIISLPTKSRENYICINNRLPYDVGWAGDFERLWIDNRDSLVVHTDKAFSVDSFRKYLASNPIIVYYPLAVPEISYLNTTLSQVKTVANTGLQCTRNNGYLNAQVKPSHLTYPVPSLVGNREYTVVHNRKNINGSTKPITLDLGGTQVELNDASGKTLVKTPSSLKHSSLIFIGGESTVDHIMVLDGDWTNKPIEYFENMMGHDTDAIITIIGNGQINDVAEQYLW